MTLQDSTRREATVDPLVLTKRADAGQHLAVWVVDLLVVVAPIVGAVALFGAGLPAGAWIFAVIAAVIVAATAWALARTGRTLGHVAAGARTVSIHSGAPAGARLIGDTITGRLRTFTLRRGARDPLTPALAPFRFPRTAPQHAVAPIRPYTRAATIELDSGQRLGLESALVIGRSPSTTADAPASVYQWPDLSRTLSKSHARLEWDGRIVWVTDLGSTNGTFLGAAGVGVTGGQRLIAFQRTPLPPTAVLRLGDRSLTVTVPA